MPLSLQCTMISGALLVSALTFPSAAADLPTIVGAARSGNTAELRALLARNAAVNAAEPDGATALHWAAYRDNLESVELLLKAGANANASNDLGATPLWAAAQNGSLPIVRRLLEAGANPNAPLLKGETPLMVASRSGYPEVAALLLAKGANPDARGARGQTALMWAVSQHHPAVVRVLLAGKADLHLKSEVYNEVMAVPPHGYLGYNKAIPHGGETAFMFAARVGDLDCAKLLLDAGANANDKDAWGVTAVTLAAHSGFTALVELLLDRGANPNLAEAGFAPLHEAIMRRDARMITALLNHGADPNIVLKTWTPTRRSSEDWNFHPALVGATPYWLAARFLQPDMMRLLVERGANPKYVHRITYIAEAGFGQSERTETVSALMAALGTIRVQPWTAIDPGERQNLLMETVKLAIEHGSDVNLANNDGRTPLDAAKALKNEALVNYLESKGAKPGAAAAARPARPAAAH